MALKSLDEWHLSDKQRHKLDELIAHPSHNVRANDPESIRRLQRKLEYIKSQIGTHCDGIYDMRGKGIPYMVARLGEETDAVFRLFVNAHVDTFVGDGGMWENMHAIGSRDPRGDRLEAHGIYDMGASVRNSMRLIRMLHAKKELPPGLCVYFGFMGDEELRSFCAQDLLTNWPQFRHVDFFMSSEIGPLDVPEGDDRMRIIDGRKGLVKTALEIMVTRVGGHGAKGDAPDASTEGQRMMNMFCPDPAFPPHPKLQAVAPALRTHVWGKEVIRVAETHASSAGQSKAQKWLQEFKMTVVPPSSLESALRAQVEAMERLRDMAEWERRDIHGLLKFNDNETSYPPYESDRNHPYVGVAANAIVGTSGEWPVYTHGESNADENLFAIASGKPVISVPIKGGGAHSPREWISAADMERNFWFFYHLIRDRMREFAEAKFRIGQKKR